MLLQLIRKIKFDLKADRLGPDILFTHYRLYFKKSMRNLCLKKFKKFSEGAEFRPGAFAINCSKISIGRNVIIRPTTMLFADGRVDGASITIEDDVLIGSGVHFYVGNHAFKDPSVSIINQGHEICKPILIRTGSWIGANSIILPGVEIGKNAVVGAGSIVTRNVPEYCVVAGNPARLIKVIK